MKLLKIIQVLLCVAVIYMLSGCAATGKIEQLQPISVDMNNYDRVVVNVTSQVSGAEQEINLLQATVVKKIKQRGQFKEVISADNSQPASAGLELDSTIIALKKVDSSMRMMLGALAGQAHVVVDVELIDIPSAAGVGEFQAEGKSSGGSIFAGTTEQAIDLAAEKIVNCILPK